MIEKYIPGMFLEREHWLQTQGVLKDKKGHYVISSEEFNAKLNEFFFIRETLRHERTLGYVKRSV